MPSLGAPWLWPHGTITPWASADSNGPCRSLEVSICFKHQKKKKTFQSVVVPWFPCKGSVDCAHPLTFMYIMKYYLVIKKELNNAICRDVHRPEDCQTEWNKSEREKQISYIKTCILFSRSVVSDSASLWTAARQACLSIANSQSLLKLMPIKLVMPSNHLILCHPLLLLPSVFPSIRVFSKESVLRIRWQKVCSFSFSISPSNEYSALISFRIDWLDLLAVQGSLKSLLHHYSSKASILRCSAFFMVQLPHPYMTTGKP